jgi:hypothetical protein
MKTKISLILLGLGLASAAAYAGTIDTTPMPVSNDINVTAPYQTGMWSFGATAVLMQPTNKAFTYADSTSANIDGNQVNFGSSHQTIDQGYHWWFGADITYAFPGNGRDMTLAYEGLHGNDTDSTSANDSLVTSTFSGLPYVNAEGKTETSYDAGDLTFGQKLDVGSRIRLHPFMGLRYARINTIDTGNYNSGDDLVSFPGFEDVSYAGESKLENTFTGIGPRFGSDAQINLGQGFSVRGRLGLSALIGSNKVVNNGNFTIFNDAGDVDTTFAASNKNDSQTRVVPELDGRLGLNYTYDFDSSMALGVEAGWQATNYFNVTSDQYQTFPFAGQHYESTSNFGIQGPYARIQLDVA